jgi:uncharacterized phage protein (TIGR01671 family)
MAGDINFKCWDSENNKMHYQTDDNYIQLYLDNKYTMFDSEDNVIVSNVINRDNIFMQYIGWEDKNGKSIYYGDIVKYKAFWGENENEMGTAIIHRYFNNGVSIMRRFASIEPATIKKKVFYATYASFEGVVETIWYDDELFDLEVVGNIFETPELVNK